MEQYYEVTAKCGHVGRDKYYEGHFFIKASNGKEAAKIIRFTPRVKHNHSDAILSVNRITEEEYISGLEAKKQEAYFNCKSRHQQQELWDEIIINVRPETEKRKSLLYSKTKNKNVNRNGIRNPYKFKKFNSDYGR